MVDFLFFLAATRPTQRTAQLLATMGLPVRLRLSVERSIGRLLSTRTDSLLAGRTEVRVRGQKAARIRDEFGEILYGVRAR